MAVEVAGNHSYSASLLQPMKKKDGKRFRMFNKRNAKKTSGQSAALAGSDPLRAHHLSLDSDSKWRSAESLTSNSMVDSRPPLSDSDTSSRHSFLTIDGEFPKLSDEELAEALVHPPASWPPPPSVSVFVMCVCVQ